MNHQWLRHKQENGSLIVVFGGWALGAHIFSHLEGDADILFVSDYRSIDWCLPDVSAYDTIKLVAWSFGIASYCHWQAANDDPFQRKIAIAGSPWPIDDERGIPLKAFQKTVDVLSDASFQVFLARAMGTKGPHQEIHVDARRAELLAVQTRGFGPPQRWDRVWLASKDRIFPFAALERAWQDHEDQIKVIDAPHVPFSLWQRWEEILS